MIRAFSGFAVAIVLVTAAPAAAHPFGVPPEAHVAADRHEVSVTWTAAGDDWSTLATQLGALPRSQTFALNGSGGVEQVAGATVSGNLAGSGALADYVRRHLVVLQNGVTCAAVTVASDDVVERGVVLRSRCPQPVGTVTLQSTMLHDVHPAYRTMVRTAGGGAALLTMERPATAVTLADPPVTEPQPQVTPEPAGGVEGRLLAAFDRATTPAVVALSLAVALTAGALHALAPGHGKTVAAAAMLAGRGRLRGAGLLGLSVAVMHTASAGAIAAALVLADTADWLGAVTGWLSVGAGAVVAAVGIGLLRRARRRPHSHAVPSRSMVSLGLSGGLVPSPTALFLLVAGLLSGRAVLALVLVAAFGAGMAATITVAGVSASMLDRAARRRGGALARLATAGPVVGATGLTLAGLAYAANGARALL